MLSGVDQTYVLFAVFHPLRSSLLYLASISIVLPTAAAHVIPASSQQGDWVLSISRVSSVFLLLR